MTSRQEVFIVPPGHTDGRALGQLKFVIASRQSPATSQVTPGCTSHERTAAQMDGSKVD
jgi:hypothetical protein